jgi:putative ABC transport system substrate-binding protein
MRRRDFIAGVGSAAASSGTWPYWAHAQQRTLPVVGVIDGSGPESAHYATAFRAGLGEQGFVDGQNVVVDYHWLEGQFVRLPAVLDELVRLHVAVIAVPGITEGALAAKAATTTIPIVFGSGDDPVRLGLVQSLARPGGNLTGMSIFTVEAVPKLLGLLHDLVPGVVRLAVLINPQSKTAAEHYLREVQAASRLIGLPIDVLSAGTSREIEEALTKVHAPGEALFVVGDAFFGSRRVQLTILAARRGIPAAFTNRGFVEAGGLMSYGANVTDMFRQVGAYAGQILKGTKPADLPVAQATKFEFAINMPTARALGIEVPPGLLSSADLVIE